MKKNKILISFVLVILFTVTYLLVYKKDAPVVKSYSGDSMSVLEQNSNKIREKLNQKKKTN